MTIAIEPLYRKENKEKKQRSYTKNKAKKIKSDNCTRSNREQSNIGKITIFNRTIFISKFRGSNKIFADFIVI